MRTKTPFVPLTDAERNQLATALHANGDENNNVALLMNKRDTSFDGTTTDVPEDEVICAIKNVPTHY